MKCALPPLLWFTDLAMSCRGWFFDVSTMPFGVATLLLLACGSGPTSEEEPEPDRLPITLVPVTKSLQPRSDEQFCFIELDMQGKLPAELSTTGCLSSGNMPDPALDLIPYDVNAPLWTDGALKARFIALAPSQALGFQMQGQWGFPEGSSILKNFAIEFVEGVPATRRTVETRVMLRLADDWHFASYRWRDDGSDADRIDDGITVEYAVERGGETQQLDYYFPDGPACKFCHGSESLGPRTEQLNRPLDGQPHNPNQLEEFARIGLFSDALPTAVEAMDSFAVPSTAPTTDAARAYLHANCAHCHRPGGWAPPGMDLDLRNTTSFSAMRVCNVPVQYTPPLTTSNIRVVPGSPGGSNLLQRMATTEIWKMPAIGATTIDPLGVDVVTRWIAGLDGCE